MELKKPSSLLIESPAHSGRTFAWPQASGGALLVGGPGLVSRIRGRGFDRLYLGSLEIGPAPGQPNSAPPWILNRLDPDDYAVCVAAAEAGFSQDQPEYLRALCVAARSFAQRASGRHHGYDLCDYTHCQLYQGLPPRYEEWKKVLAPARGLVLEGKGEILFHRCCGGSLDPPAALWGNHAATGPVLADAWGGEQLCKKDPFFRWTRHLRGFQVETVVRGLPSAPINAALIDFQCGKKTPAGRNRTFKAVFGSGAVLELDGPKFLSAFGSRYGWRTFPSAWFNLRPESGGWRVEGRGLGHGAGLCQSGARRQAELGRSFRDILAFYFPNHRLRQPASLARQD